MHMHVSERARAVDQQRMALIPVIKAACAFLRAFLFSVVIQDQMMAPSSICCSSHLSLTGGRSERERTETRGKTPKTHRKESVCVSAALMLRAESEEETHKTRIPLNVCNSMEASCYRGMEMRKQHTRAPRC